MELKVLFFSTSHMHLIAVINFILRLWSSWLRKISLHINLELERSPRGNKSRKIDSLSVILGYIKNYRYRNSSRELKLFISHLFNEFFIHHRSNKFVIIASVLNLLLLVPIVGGIIFNLNRGRNTKS